MIAFAMDDNTATVLIVSVIAIVLIIRFWRGGDR